MTEAERERLLGEGAVIQGMVVRSESSAADRRISQVRLSVRFKDGQTVEFGKDWPICISRRLAVRRRDVSRRCGEAEQLRHLDRITEIQLPLSVGERVAVRHDAADRSKIVIDVPRCASALHHYIRPTVDCTGALPELRRSG